MVRPVDDRDVAEALATISAGLDALFDAGLHPTDNKDARAMIKRLERVGRRMDAAQVDLVSNIEKSGIHQIDGHASAKVMVRHVARLSGGEAFARAASAKALRDLPGLADSYRAGEVGTCQVRRLARAHSNPRVREQLIQDERRFVQLAKGQSYRDFDNLVGDWTRRVDEDGTIDKTERTHRNRDAKLTQEFAGGFNFIGGWGGLQGAQMSDIFAHFIDAEFRTDWEKAVAEHGDRACVDLLNRTDAQRRADAFLEVFMRAATSPVGGTRPSIVTNLVTDLETFEREARRLVGGEVEPFDPWGPKFRSHTLNGNPIAMAEVLAAALVGRIRRVVMGSDGVVVDLGRLSRLFTGAARLSVQLSANECCWPGCHVPVTQCQIDHISPWSERVDGGGGGCTRPGNGAPLCGRHNRLKEAGHAARRDPITGEWTLLRPDGTIVEV